MTNDIDSRPSDAIALAVRTGSPLYVAEEVMKAASFIPTSENIEDETQSMNESKESSEVLPNNNLQETKLAKLQDQLREAIEKEDYERAAKLRDKINKLTGGSN